MSNKRKRRTVHSERKATITLDFFKTKEPVKKAKEWAPWREATEGTLEWFRKTYYAGGFEALKSEVRRWYPKANQTKFVHLMEVILFGTDRLGQPLQAPKPPDPKLMEKDIELYRFTSRVYKEYNKED